MIVCKKDCFTLYTTHTSYQMAVGPKGMLLHTYYGTRLPDEAPNLADSRVPHGDPGCWPDLMPQELSGAGTADHRTPAVVPEYADGTEAAAFVFERAKVHIGKPQLQGLPMFRDGDGVETLSVFLKDACGLGEMSRRFHTAIRTRLLPPKWQDMTAPRPVLINSWEACYFDFDEKKLLELAVASKKADIDLFVLDDGWFKGRNDTSSSLGDWAADKNKLPNGLPGLCKKINLLGLQMGLWVEPEAISPDSDLYRSHPDWAFTIAGREPLEIRQQYTLDFSRPEVVDGIWEQLDAILQSCPLKYLKWDMNRSLAHVYNAKLPAKRQGEVYHRYVMGVYELQRRLTEKYPDLLLENCAGGGARFDCGMLYYSPQIWCSDNTDARARLVIQYGTSLFYPGCVMGAHFSTVLNHCTGHVSTVEARMAAALSGTFGFELDLTKYSEEELAELRPYVAWYRQHGALLRGGELHRLVDPEPNGLGAAWMIAAENGSEAAVFAVGDALTGAHGTTSLNSRPRLVLEGLDPAAQYTDEEEQLYLGSQLMTTGLELPGGRGQTPAKIWYLKKV